MKNLANKNKWVLAVIALIPLGAVLNSFEKALGMGIILALVVLLSNLILYGLYKVVDEKLHIVLLVTVTTLLTAVLARSFELFFYDFYVSVGIYFAGLIINSALLLMLTKSEDSLGTQVYNNLKIVSRIFVLSLIFGLVRELLGTGTISLGLLFGSQVNLLGDSLTKYAMTLFVNPQGGLIILSFIAIIVNLIVGKESEEVWYDSFIKFFISDIRC